MSGDRKYHPLDGGSCQTPMFSGGSSDGFCGRPSFGEQFPQQAWHPILQNRHRPYCFGPCCDHHGGPAETGVRFFQDGTEGGRPMWCAVWHDFENLAASPAGFSVHPELAEQQLKAETARVKTSVTAP